MMRLVIATILVLLSALGLAAQTVDEPKSVSKDDIHKLEMAARAQLKKHSLRRITGMHYHSAGVTSTITTEFNPPDHLRVTDDVGGVRRSEYIEVGHNHRYLKNGDEPWQTTHIKKIEDSGMHAMQLLLVTSGAEIKHEYFYLGEQHVGDIVADLYEVVTHQVFRSSPPRTITIRKKFWFDKQHRFVKVETDVTDTAATSDSHEVTAYQYDIPIAIEAPIK